MPAQAHRSWVLDCLVPVRVFPGLRGQLISVPYPRHFRPGPRDPKRIFKAQELGKVLDFILSTLSWEANVALLHRRYFEKEENYLSEIWPKLTVLPLYLKFYEYEMFIERELCLYFIAFLNNCQHVRISLISSSHQKK